MKDLISIATCLGFLSTLAAGASIPNPPSFFEKHPYIPRRIRVIDVQGELGPQLSKGSLIYGPEDTRFEEGTERWNLYTSPIVHLIVEPAKESDVPKIVKYCNRKSVEFMANNRGHGFTRSITAFNGVQINLHQLDLMSIQPHGNSAWFGGGVYAGQVTKYLWKRGYVMTTGGCDCVGLVGPGLGGGHGRHEGLYGLVADNMLQLNVVLADGSTIRINKDKHADLYWAMKGAGHNFGIVTSIEMKIHSRGPDTWHYHNYIWRGDKLEAVFKAMNKFHSKGKTPVAMAINLGETEPVIAWNFAYRGKAKDAEKLLAPLNALDPVWQQQGDVSYPEISVIQGTYETDFVCQPSGWRITTTAGLQEYDIKTERQIFENFKKRVKTHPELAAGTALFHEGYSTAAVEAIDHKSTAIPSRDDYHLMLASFVVPNNDKKMAKTAQEWADEVRDMWNAAQPHREPSTYVNYANGYESVESIYGPGEPWRLERLRKLKAKYDPNNRFRFYNPIVRQK